MKTYKKENIRLVFSILFTTLLLVGSTYLWKNLNNNYKLVDGIINNDSQVILMKDIDVCTDEEGERLLGYNFIVDSNYDVNKNYSVQIISDHINNEDIHYSIDNGETMILNNDNMIIKKNISAFDKHSYVFKVWLTNDYKDNNINVLINFE